MSSFSYLNLSIKVRKAFRFERYGDYDNMKIIVINIDIYRSINISNYKKWSN